MKAVFSFKRALLRNNKRYFFAFIFASILLFLLAGVAFSLRGGRNLNPSPEEIQLALNSYSNKLAETEARFQNGEIRADVYWRITAPWRFYLNEGSFEGQFLDLNQGVAGEEFASVCFFLIRFVLPGYSLIFGAICGAFFFSTDFSSGRIKNVFCLSASRDHQLFLFLKASLVVCLGAPVLLWLVLFLCSSPIYSLRLTHWWNSSFYSQSVLSCCLATFIPVVLLSWFGFFLSSSLGVAWRNLLSSALLPCFAFTALMALSFYINSESPNGFKEIYPSFIPLGGYLFSCAYGQTLSFWIHSGLFLIVDISLFPIFRRLYDTTDL